MTTETRIRCLKILDATSKDIKAKGVLTTIEDNLGTLNHAIALGSTVAVGIRHSSVVLGFGTLLLDFEFFLLDLDILLLDFGGVRLAARLLSRSGDIIGSSVRIEIGLLALAATSGLGTRSLSGLAARRCSWGLQIKSVFCDVD